MVLLDLSFVIHLSAKMYFVPCFFNCKYQALIPFSLCILRLLFKFSSLLQQSFLPNIFTLFFILPFHTVLRFSYFSQPLLFLFLFRFLSFPQVFSYLPFTFSNYCFLFYFDCLVFSYLLFPLFSSPFPVFLDIQNSSPSLNCIYKSCHNPRLMSRSVI